MVVVARCQSCFLSFFFLTTLPQNFFDFFSPPKPLNPKPMFAQKRQSSGREKSVREREREEVHRRRKKNTKSKEGGRRERAQNRVIYTHTHAVVYEEDIKEIQNERKKR